MKIIKALLCMGAIAAMGMSLSACADETDFSASTPAPYMGPKTTAGIPLTGQLIQESRAVNPKIVFTVGECIDKTGKYLDADQLRYSRAVTQACPDLLANYLKMAGFKVAERNPYNMGLIGQEYKLSHTFAAQTAPGSKPVNIGLIQRGGPNGGLVGANYLVTGAISMYDSSVRTGGGGVDVDSIGVSVQKSTADVGITLRIVDMSTGLIVSSLDLTTVVSGKSTDFHLTRFIGDVATSLATVAGGTTATTILQPASNAHVISGELGSAMQAPIDYAVNDVIVASLARQLEVNQALFYKKPVRFHYNVATN